MVYVIQVCRQLSSRIRMFHPDSAVWHIPLPCVQWRTPDDGQRNCPKHVEFHFQNKFEKLVHLVGFIIRICHDARSHERKWSRIYFCILHLYRKNMRTQPALIGCISAGHVINTTGRCCPNSCKLSVWNASFWLNIGSERGDISSGSSASCS
jgi:hypothetical protein